MRLARYIYEGVRKYGLHVTYVDRQTAQWMSKWEHNHSGLWTYTGWYWWSPGYEDEPFGPFKTRSAAYTNAYERVVLGVVPSI